MEQPNFYAILPANVRYCKELTPFEKILYAEITALTQKDGYCWASNKYFAELFGVSETHISLRIKKFCELGFLSSEVDKSAGNKRKIFVGEVKKVSGKTSLTTVKDPIKPELNTSLTTVKDPYLTTVKENNIIYNNINNNKKNNNSKELLLKKARENLKNFGEFGNVKLTEEEVERLKADYGLEIFEKYLKILDEGIEMKGYKYKNHNLAFRKWLEKDGVYKKIQKAKTNFIDLL